ncbi:MAG: hypothetical protein HKO96_10520 [Flavobacteriaceae bacterium]|nr:hypothetical protein [Flavobacteriaceae bacterium]NNK70899.1 hypothetical protein [Flavobacteriaceae bacterium]
MNFDKVSKTKKLAYSILFDALGFVSFVFPFFDLIWAPAAGYLMTKMYKGKTGKIAGIITFIEEALPLMDVIPTFSIMWIYTYVWKGETDEKVIEID